MSESSSPFSSVAVFCGSSHGVDPAFAEAAATLGETLARRGIELVYGGGHVGLMGVAADAAMAHGGRVHGVITRALAELEVAHPGLTELEVVETMHDRKASMADAADGFVMLPGGFGTLDEFFEAVTWTQLGVHAKPCAVLDVAGYFEPLLAFLDGAAEAGLLRPEHRALVLVEREPDVLLDRLAAWEAPGGARWLTPDQR
jgi:uncharacterized protein (TIGR00730 family)